MRRLLDGFFLAAGVLIVSIAAGVIAYAVADHFT